MKSLMIIMWTLLLSTRIWPQAQTLIGGNIESGGFGGPVVKVGNVYDETAVIIGGRGGWIINHQYILGGGVYGLVTEIPSRLIPDLEMTMGYGGIEIEYIRRPNKLTHLSFIILLGGGGVGFSEPGTDTDENEYEYKSFYMAEPSVQLMLNVTQFFRAGIGGSYRFVKGVTGSGELSNDDIGGPTFVITFKFGTF